MRRALIVALAAAAFTVSGGAMAPPSYLFVWVGDMERKSSDFLAVIDATPSSSRYGQIVASIPTGEIGTHPHHTEAEMPADGHLLANGFGAGRTWLFDLTKPLEPRIVTSFGELGGYSHPHTFVRLADGNVLTTFQYRARQANAEMSHDTVSQPGSSDAGGMHHMTEASEATTGGLVLMDERGRLLKSGDASDPAIPDKHIFPYAALPLPSMDRAVSTTTNMNPGDSLATSEWIQLWRLSDLKLLKSIALKPGPRGNENRYTGEPRLLPDGRNVYIHTFNCGLYLLSDLDRPQPKSEFVMAFEGDNCGVPVLAGHYWLQPVPAANALVSMDVSDPRRPREVSRVKLAGEEPHWIAIDHTGRRVVLNSGGYAKSNRLYIINFDPKNGRLSLDTKFRDKGGAEPGISMSGKTWPHGFTGNAAPHGTVFSR